MSNLFYLGEQDFYLDKGVNGPVVCCTQKDVCFVMFHADPSVCTFCDAAKPEFVRCAQVIAGAKFGLCNLSRAQNLISKSFNSITPLNKVPLFILFVKGRPFMNYNGEKTLKHLADFMQKALQRLQQQQVFSQGGVTNNVPIEALEKTPHGLAYDYDYITVTNSSTIGQITCSEEGVCYLTAKEGFGSTEPQPNQARPSQQPQHNAQNTMNPQVYQQNTMPVNQQLYQQRMQQPYYGPQQSAFGQSAPAAFAPPQQNQRVQQGYYPAQMQGPINPYMTHAMQQPMQQAMSQPQYPQQGYQPTVNNSFF